MKPSERIKQITKKIIKSGHWEDNAERMAIIEYLDEQHERRHEPGVN